MFPRPRTVKATSPSSDWGASLNFSTAACRWSTGVFLKMGEHPNLWHHCDIFSRKDDDQFEVSYFQINLMKFGYHGGAKAIFSDTNDTVPFASFYNQTCPGWAASIAACGVWVHDLGHAMASHGRGCLRKGARAALQFYPETAAQAGSQLSATCCGAPVR